MRFVKLIFLSFLVLATIAEAQDADVFARARRMVDTGDARAGRALVDSALAAAAPGSAAYAEALYWRGVLAAEGKDARTDFLRVAIEYPLSPRAGDALLRLAQYELTRGDRANAVRYLDRLEREHPMSPVRAAGRYWAGRVLLEAGKTADACGALREARRLAAARDVELINQIDYYARPCVALEADARARADSIAADSIQRVTTRQSDAKKSTAAPTTHASTKGRWSVQVAAYGDRESALALVKRLKAKGHEARVTPTKPWRVRVGYYPSRADAVNAARTLSSAKSKAMVVEAEGR